MFGWIAWLSWLVTSAAVQQDETGPIARRRTRAGHHRGRWTGAALLFRLSPCRAPSAYPGGGAPAALHTLVALLRPRTNALTAALRCVAFRRTASRCMRACKQAAWRRLCGLKRAVGTNACHRRRDAHRGLHRRRSTGSESFEAR